MEKTHVLHWVNLTNLWYIYLKDYYSAKNKTVDTCPKKPLYLLVINFYSYGVDHQSFLSYTLNTARRKACNYPIIV